MNNKWVKRLGCVMGVPVILITGLLLYKLGRVLLAEAQHKFLSATHVTVTWPSNWGCDEFKEAYLVTRVEYPNDLVRWQYKGTTLLVPYPAEQYGDTTAFYTYYKDLVKAGREDTVVLQGHFGYSIGVGERGWMYQCEDIPYFEVETIYSKRGKLLRKFTEMKHKKPH